MRILDLFCGAGGAAMGYHRAGFDVVGVDINPQPHYPFEFHQGDAMTWPLDGFDAIHASPPCQAYSKATAWRGDPDSHPDLLVLVVERLTAHGVPYVVENVPGAPFEADMLLCGSMFGLPIRRHRYFVVRPMPPLQFSSGCRHKANDLAFMHKGERAYAAAMGVTWTDVKSARQSIPPAYTEHIGRQMIAAMTEDVAA
jgi:DNA (cytosine-5)-methyltransferase 1